ncbi:MAG: OadG family protein [Paludibacteraceae bacterium]
MFNLFNKSKKAKTNKELQLVNKPVAANDSVATAGNSVDNEELVAAFMALHLYTNEDIHDQESNVLTIDRIQRRYSPWSSKIYSMNNLHR